MWLDNILEAKAKLGISSAEMSRRSKIGLTERTIKRILNRESPFPHVDSVVDLGATVGLSAFEIFSETCVVVSDVNVSALQAEVETLRAERDNAIAEIAVLRAANDELRIKIDNLKDELLDTHKYYINKEQINRRTAE